MVAPTVAGELFASLSSVDAASSSLAGNAFFFAGRLRNSISATSSGTSITLILTVFLLVLAAVFFLGVGAAGPASSSTAGTIFFGLPLRFLTGASADMISTLVDATVKPRDPDSDGVLWV